jgi:hypothetical protein
MPTGPKGQKRPADVIGNAVRVMQLPLARKPTTYRTTARTRLQSSEVKGGKKRAESMTPNGAPRC